MIFVNWCHVLQEVGLSEEDVGMEKFREVGSMVCALKNGDLEPAKAYVLSLVI